MADLAGEFIDLTAGDGTRSADRAGELASPAAGFLTKNAFAPVITWDTAQPGDIIDRLSTLDPIVTDDASGLARVVVLALYGTGVWEVVGVGTPAGFNFSQAYENISSGSITADECSLDIGPNLGWPTAALRISIVATDADGNEAAPLDYDFIVSNADTAAPTIGGFSPASGSILALDATATFDVTDLGSGLANVLVSAQLADGTTEPVHNFASFDANYGSSVRSTIAGGYRYALTRTGGWPTSITILIQATDVAGLTSSASYLLRAPDVTAPAIGNVSPPNLSTIADAFQSVSFDVTDARSLGRVIVALRFPDIETDDFVFDGSSFTAKYAGSSRAAIAGGWRFTILRRGGWPSKQMILWAEAFDATGNEA